MLTLIDEDDGVIARLSALTPVGPTLGPELAADPRMPTARFAPFPSWAVRRAVAAWLARYDAALAYELPEVEPDPGWSERGCAAPTPDREMARGPILRVDGVTGGW